MSVGVQTLLFELSVSWLPPFLGRGRGGAKNDDSQIHRKHKDDHCKTWEDVFDLVTSFLFLFICHFFCSFVFFSGRHGSLPLHFYIFTFSTGGHPSSPGSASSALSASSAVSEANDAKLGKQKRHRKNSNALCVFAACFWRFLCVFCHILRVFALKTLFFCVFLRVFCVFFFFFTFEFPC